MMYKLRQIASLVNGSPCMGISVPSNIAIFFEGTSFNIKKSGTSIVFTSGAKAVLTKEQIDNYDFEKVRI